MKRDSQNAILSTAFVATLTIGAMLPQREGEEWAPNAIKVDDACPLACEETTYIPIELPATLGISVADYAKFREAVAYVEHARYNEMGGAHHAYAGRFQFGKVELSETARSLGIATPKTGDFLKDPLLQERFFERYTLNHHRYLMKQSARYRALASVAKLEALARAHNEGAAGTARFLDTGAFRLDGFGTDPARYAAEVRKRMSR